MRKVTILIVDDEEVNIEIVAKTLESEYDIAVAYDGDEAIEIVQEINPELILLDIQMPNMDGYEVAKYLKSNENTKKIPFIFLTSSNTSESIIKGFEYGASDYVTKPFNIHELKVRVSNHIDRYKFQKQLEELNSNLEQLVIEKTNENLKKEKLLVQQSKLASMGEMMDAIAHQWKQPLNIISMSIGNLKFESYYGDEEISKEMIVTTYSEVIGQISHLVETIDEFRKFFRTNVTKENTNLFEVINSVLNLQKDIFIDNKIEVKLQGDEKANYNLIRTEFKHIFINLINNARDAFIENDVKNREIVIDISNKDKHIIINITDSAGGIPSNIIGNIFKPNFTTKEDGKGTGIGLYMSTQIIEKIGGKIIVENVDNGAKFGIILPKNI